MASVKSARNAKTALTSGKIDKKKAKSMKKNRIEIKEPFMETQQIFKQGKGAELRKAKTLKKPKKK